MKTWVAFVTLLTTAAMAFAQDKQEPPKDSSSQRRALPAPFQSPPLPSGEYQGYPLVGTPPDDTVFPLIDLLYRAPFGEALKKSRVKAYGWLNFSLNWSTSEDSNTPDSYWTVPDHFLMDQFVFRVEREVDSAQEDHVDIGFRSSFLYGADYRYLTAGGWFSDQLLEHNRLYGFDPTEQYVDVYIPRVAEGLIIRAGRWVSCPDIETSFAPENTMGTHSLLFTFDTATQTGSLLTLMINKNWTVQAGIHAGTDMAPWYKGAAPTGVFGIRWVASDNNDSIYLLLNAINDAKFRRFDVDGQPAGHDNFNYLIGTWQHKLNDNVNAKLEAYFMWQRDAAVGGTPSNGPVERFGGGGGIGADIPGTTLTYGAVNYWMLILGDKDFLTFRNEILRDEDGERSGFPGTYSNHAVGWTHNFTPLLQIRPEVGYYRNWDQDAFDLGKRKDMWLVGLDVTVRF